MYAGWDNEVIGLAGVAVHHSRGWSWRYRPIRPAELPSPEAKSLDRDRRSSADVRRLVASGIPVMGHVGLTPQSVHALGGYRVQGRDDENADRIAAEATALEEAGAFSVVLELIPRAVAARITGALGVPTIGIGAGPDVDGQVLVLPDMLGLNEGFQPRFLRRFGELGEAARAAVAAYAAAVRAGDYPADEHSF
jgi:3-methyl-2-oxobutanoate hydroxymethyltransferase